jgi:hypothetical protein
LWDAGRRTTLGADLIDNLWSSPVPPRIAIIVLSCALVAGCKPPPNAGGTASAPVSAAAGSAVGPGKVIPVGLIAADVMEFGASQRMTDLAKRRADAIRRDPKWWLEHARTAKPGQSPPYDPRIGLTADEYAEFNTPQKTSTHKRGDATFAVRDKGNQVYYFDGGQSLPDLTGIEIDLKTGVVKTPYGVTGPQRDLTMPDTTPTGAWTGLHWKYASPDSSDQAGTTVTLAIGRLKSSGRGILNYYVKRLTPPEKKKQMMIMLNYDLPAGQ